MTPFWIIEEQVNPNKNFIKIKEELKRRNISYYELNLLDNKLRMVTKEEIFSPSATELLLSLSNLLYPNIFVYGTKIFTNKLFELGFKNADLGLNMLDSENVSKLLGCNYLNNDQIVDYLENLIVETDIFIRPSENSKLFDGVVMSKEQFVEFKKENKDKDIFHKEKIVVAPVKKIISEFRFFIVNNEISTYSSYKHLSKYNEELFVSNELILYTNLVVKEIQKKSPNLKSYVMDIAVLEDSFKVIELNNINNSGLYNTEVHLLVEDLDYLFK